MREGRARRARAQMCIQERLMGASRAREGVRGLPRHAQHLNFLAMTMGPKEPGRGSVGMAMFTSKALGRRILFCCL